MSAKKNVLYMAGTFVLGIVVGGGLLYNDSVYNEVKKAIDGGGTQNAVAGASGTVSVDISSMDLETAMMTIQSQRAGMLEEQLKTQLEAIQARNNEIGKLNEAIGELKAARPTGTDPKAAVTLSAELATKLTTNGIKVATTQAEVDIAIEQLKGKIDSLNSSQQMDMLRMQSLTNKRNEAFDLMTNFIKKMAESRSSIIGNMR